MDNLLSKFNLYELFRILLPGSYFVYLFFQVFGGNILPGFTNHWWAEIALIYFIFSLLTGTFIYSLDLPRLFKGIIKNLPTNLMSKHHQELYSKLSEREVERIYYMWYENSKSKSKVKTELQSGLYHLSVNFFFVSFLGLVIFLLKCNCNDYIFRLNTLIMFCSAIASFSIVKFRLSHQWRRNYLEFENEVIIGTEAKS